MTLEELKAEARKYGYQLTKIIIGPCICGSNDVGLYFIGGDVEKPYYRKCHKCEFASEPASTKHEANNKWNELIGKF